MTGSERVPRCFTRSCWAKIKERSLSGHGVGWVDAAIQNGAVLATFDEALQSCAKRLGIPCMGDR